MIHRWSCLLMVTVFMIITFVPQDSLALSPLYSFRHLDEQTNVSPSPSPSQGVNSASSGGSKLQQSCDTAARSCHHKNITACLTYSQSGLREEVCLLVHNNGESPLHVKILILPANNTITDTELPGQHTEKINISSAVDSSSAISLTTSDGDCVIHAAAPAPENYYEKYSSYGTYINLANGAYLVVMLLIVGGILTFIKLRIRSRHLEGVPYQELEMGNSTTLDVEENEKETWDQDWDDDWGDEKPVKSGNENPIIVEQTNKLPNSNGRRKERDD